MRDVEKLEKNNDIKIHVFRLNEKGEKIFPYKISQYKIKNLDIEADEEDYIIDVLQLIDKKNAEKSHFCWIKSLHKAIYSQTSNHNRLNLCRRCLFRCSSAHKFARHRELCSNHKVQAVRFPRKNCPTRGDIFSYIKGEKSCVTEKESRAPYVMYADLEAVLAPVSIQCGAKTKIVQRHLPSAMSYIVTR